VSTGRRWFRARGTLAVRGSSLPSSPGAGSGGLSDAARSEFCELYLDMLGRFDRLFDIPAPYISALHQAPVRRGRDELALHIELFTIQRAPGS